MQKETHVERESLRMIFWKKVDGDIVLLLAS